MPISCSGASVAMRSMRSGVKTAAKRRVGGQRGGQQPHVLLRAPGVPPGVFVARGSQRRERLHDETLRLLPAHAFRVGPPAFRGQLRRAARGGAKPQARPGRSSATPRRRSPQTTRARRTTPSRRRPRPGRRRARRPRATRPTTPASAAARADSSSRVAANSGRSALRPPSSVSASVACSSTPGKRGSSAVATTSRTPSAVAPTKTIRPASRPAGTRPGEHVGGRHVRKRAAGAAKPKERPCPCASSVTACPPASQPQAAVGARFEHERLPATPPARRRAPASGRCGRAAGSAPARAAARRRRRAWR